LEGGRKAPFFFAFAPPFAFPAPLAVIDERCTHSGGIYRDKRLGLWELASLNMYGVRR
jgi:hypothetical protein